MHLLSPVVRLQEVVRPAVVRLLVFLQVIEVGVQPEVQQLPAMIDAFPVLRQFVAMIELYHL